MSQSQETYFTRKARKHHVKPASKPQIFWVGAPPKTCKSCLLPLDGTFVKGQTRNGAKAIMHPGCNQVHGYSVQSGGGQLYERQPDGRFLKTLG